MDQIQDNKRMNRNKLQRLRHDQKNELQIHQNMTVLLNSMLRLLTSDMRFPLGYIQAGVCSSNIVIWVTRVFANVAFTFMSVPCFNEFCKFWKRSYVFEVFRQRLISFSSHCPQALFTKHCSFCLLAAKSETFLKYVCMKSEFKGTLMQI